MPPEGITSHFDNNGNYHVLNTTSFLFTIFGIYLVGWIKIFGLISKNVLNLAPASLLARQLASGTIFTYVQYGYD